MYLVIAILATLAALYQNSILLLFGLKEGAIFYAPLRFGLFLLVEAVVIWGGCIAIRMGIQGARRRAIAMAVTALSVIVACELVMPDSAFKWDYRISQKTDVLKQITVAGTQFERLPDGGFVLTYTLKFPRDAHYLTFPAYVGKPDLGFFGKYDDAKSPDYYDENYTFAAGKPYDFTVAFPEARSINYKKDKAHIDICDSKNYDMACHTIDIDVQGAENAPVRGR
jgi:hypothetical protein